jgi:hypothetical protein
MSDQAIITPSNAIAQVEDGEIMHYICQTGDTLTEKDFDGEMSPPELLGLAKPGTPGTYILLGEKVYFPSKSWTLELQPLIASIASLLLLK